MKIYIDDIIEDGAVKGKIYIESDSMQFDVNVYSGKVDSLKRELYTNEGHHTNFKNALKKVIRMKIHASTKKTVNELLEEVKEYQKYIDDICKGL